MRRLILGAVMPTPSASSRPNIIWVFGDQHRAQTLSCAGDPNVHTPNIDRLASEGVHFTSAVAGIPLCCPFRGSLLTSRYPHRCVSGHEVPLPPEIPTIAQPFREAGYHTAWFGKWHLDGFHESEGRAAHHFVPPERRGGFDAWLGYENNNSQFDCWVHGTVRLRRLSGFESDALTSEFIDHLRARSSEPDRPFFAALSLQPPHNPYVAPARWMARHHPGRVTLRGNVPPVPQIAARARQELAGYHALIENLDWNLGRIREALEESRQWENTWVVFFSDHGDMHGSHGQFLKTSPWEEAIRIPFIVGGGVPFYGRLRNARVTHPLNHVDIAPTTLGLCGLRPPAWMEGMDYSCFCLRDLECAVTPPDSAYLQLVVATRHPDSTDRPWRGVVTQDGWKYVALEHQPWLLFNLNDDPLEQVNLAHNSVYDRERSRLHARLCAWVADTQDHFALPAL